MQSLHVAESCHSLLQARAAGCYPYDPVFAKRISRRELQRAPGSKQMRGRALGGDDVVADGVTDQIAEGLTTQLAHDVGAVSFRRSDADPETISNLFISPAFRKELGHLALPLSQRGRLSLRPPAVQEALEDEL